MALRSVLSIDVEDERFQAFLRLFQQYKDALAKMPGDWQRVQGAAEPHTAAVGAMTAALLAQVELIHRLEREEQQLARTIRSAGGAMDSVARSARAVYTHVADTTRMLLRWTGITGLFSGLLGFGGLLGLDRMAGSASNLRTQGMQNFANPNSILGARVNWGPFFDPGAAMGSIARHQNVTDPSLSIIGLGGMMSAPTDQVMNAMLQKARDFLMHTPRSMWQAMPQWKIFADVFGEGGLRAIGGMSGAEFNEHMRRSQSDAAAIGVTDPTLQAAQHFAQQLERTATIIEYKLMAALDKAWPALDKLASAVGDTVVKLIGSQSFKDAIDLASKGINWLGDYLTSDQFKENLKSLAQAFYTVTDAIGRFINWLNGKTGQGADTWADPNLYSNWKYRLQHPGGSGVAPENTPAGRAAQGAREWIWNGIKRTFGFGPSYVKPENLPGGTEEEQARAAAIRYGINPDDWIALGNAEGGFNKKEWGNPDTGGTTSYGPFQMNNRGLADEFKKATGMDPALKENEPYLNDFAAWYFSQHPDTRKWSAINNGMVNRPRVTVKPQQGALGNVNPLLHASTLAAIQSGLPSGYTARITSGVREGDPGFHGKGLAEDVQIYDANGNEVRNRGSDPFAYNIYREMAIKQIEYLLDQGKDDAARSFAWGGHFGTEKGGGGELDLMHRDFGGQRGRYGDPNSEYAEAMKRHLAKGKSPAANQNIPSGSDKQSSSTDYAKPVAVGVNVRLQNQTGGSAIVSASQLA